MAQLKPPDVIAQLAEDCIREVHEELGFELDYSVETLPVLDHHCRTARQGEAWPDNAEHLAEIVGSYFGETLRRRYHHACRWVLSDDGPHAWRLEFEECFLCFNPLGAALELLLEGQAHGWNADFVTHPEASLAVENHLDKLPGVAERDFYTLSVRYEVLETIQDFLELWHASREDSPRTFESSDYEKRLAQMQPDLTADLEPES